jgi:epoxyqueuosine reductase
VHNPPPLQIGVSPPLGTELTQAVLTRAIVDAALQLGFSSAGVTSTLHFPAEKQQLQQFLDKGYAGEMRYLGEASEAGLLNRGEVATAFSGTKSVVSVALAYAPFVPIRLRKHQTEGSKVGASRASVANYALGEDYHHVMKSLLLQLADEVARLSGRTIMARPCVDTAPLFERQLAQAAGIAFLGKNTLAIIPGLGSRFVLGELLLDLELDESSQLTSAKQGCGSCTACLDICPTGAFVAEQMMDATRCISYLTIEHKGKIPHSLRAGIGNHVFGCDLCQAVCPYNHGSNPAPAHPQLHSDRFKDLDPGQLLHISSANYKRLIRGTALRRITREQFCRNLAVVLGNLGLPEHVPALEAALREHQYPLVREHAAWALVRLSLHFGLSAASEAIERASDQGASSALIMSRELAEARWPNDRKDNASA